VDVDHIGQGHSLTSNSGNGAVISNDGEICSRRHESGEISASDRGEFLTGIGTGITSPSAFVGLNLTVDVSLEDVLDSSILSRLNTEGHSVDVRRGAILRDDGNGSLLALAEDLIR